jgi:choline kinase
VIIHKNYLIYHILENEYFSRVAHQKEYLPKKLYNFLKKCKFAVWRLNKFYIISCLNKKISMTLIILAAGMASRFGSQKQIEAFGPHGETIMDYSINDAIKNGFSKVVLVIREASFDYFKKVFDEKYSEKIEINYVSQELNKIPQGFSFLPERIKPWGTGHACLMAKDCVDENFVVINADDFYGKESFKTIFDYSLKNNQNNEFAMVGYKLGSTLSDFGTVSRGVCKLDDEGYLVDIQEHTAIQKINGKIVSEISDLEENDIVSMNFWYFQKEDMQVLEDEFKEFLRIHSQELKSEFYIPTLASKVLERGKKCKVLSSGAQWQGVTYKEDAEKMREMLAKLG